MVGGRGLEIREGSVVERARKQSWHSTAGRGRLQPGGCMESYRCGPTGDDDGWHTQKEGAPGATT